MDDIDSTGPIEDQALQNKDEYEEFDEPQRNENYRPLLIRLKHEVIDLGGGQSLTVVRRSEWGAQPRPGEGRLSTELPYKYVVYQQTDTKMCSSLWECSRIVRDLQAADSQSGLSDIQYNFVVGSDGKVYTGRGWFDKPAIPDEFKHINDSALFIGFIGDFKGLSSHETMVVRVLELRDGVKVLVMTQPSWSVLPMVPEPGPPLEHPISLIRFSYTRSPPCHYSSQCIRAVQNVQADHRGQGRADITHNFLIGHDGFVYQGRGWYHQSDLPGNLSSLSPTCLDIAYIGDFSDEEPSYRMVSTALDLIRYGIKQGFIKCGFKVIPYNEDTNTEDN